MATNLQMQETDPLGSTSSALMDDVHLGIKRHESQNHEKQNSSPSYVTFFLGKKKKVEKNPFCNLTFANYLNNVVL